MRNRGKEEIARVPRRSVGDGLYASPGGRSWWLIPARHKAGVLDTRTARVVAAKALGVFAASLCRVFEATDDNNVSGDLDGTPAWRDGAAIGSRTPPDLDDIASVEDVAGIIGKPRRWIIRNASNLPFVTRISRKHYVCSRVALRRWLATRPRSPKGV